MASVILSGIRSFLLVVKNIAQTFGPGISGPEPDRSDIAN